MILGIVEAKRLTLRPQNMRTQAERYAVSEDDKKIVRSDLMSKDRYALRRI
ncbi:hypothetical protein [Methanocalculus natronophilus]|uniref:hypothetical protein n=1 Tax=Methanocalculus natronophilus TaxID=1262400 RepID=UPI0031B5CD0B